MKKFWIKHRKNITTTFLIVGWFLIGWLVRGAVQPPFSQDAAIFNQAQENIGVKSYNPPPSRRELTYIAIQAMLDSLNDKYAAFYPPEVSKWIEEEMAGNGSAMIGVNGSMHDGGFVIETVTPNGPADEAGVQVGDVVIKIDGVPVAPKMSTTEVILMIKNPNKPVAGLTVRRGDETLEFKVQRKRTEEVESRIIDGSIAYIRFDHIGKKTFDLVNTELEKLMETNPSGIILDMRYNGGGYMTGTGQILDLFLNEGVAFYAENRYGELIWYETKSGDIAENIPLVVLTSPATYSASETIAASIQDRGRGTVIGQTTHGKGSIKETVVLLDGSTIEFTVARWLSPVTRQDYEGRGVSPDIELPESDGSGVDTVLDYAVNFLKSGK